MFYHDHVRPDASQRICGEAGLPDYRRHRAKLITPAALEVWARHAADRAGQDVRADLATGLAGPDLGYCRWGGYGNLWYHRHMPAQNPASGRHERSGMDVRPVVLAARQRGQVRPVANLHNMDPGGQTTCGDADVGRRRWLCLLRRPSTGVSGDSFCEPVDPGHAEHPAGMEQFNDTPLVNGTAYRP